MTKEELIKAINQQEEALFLEQMKDYIDWDSYYATRGRLNKLKYELLEELAKTGDTVIINGKKYRLKINNGGNE